MKPLRQAAMAAALVALAVGLWWLRREQPPELDPPALVAQVRQLKQLATVRYTVQKVVGIKEPKVPVGEESILLVVQARVEAGVDLERLRPEDLTRQPDGSIVVRLPAPQLLQTAIDERETKVWDRRKTWWTPWVPYSADLEQRARLAGLEAAKTAALEMGILSQAERNAQDAVRSLFGLAGLRAVVFTRAES